MSVWRRLQRVGKKAAKFQFTTSLQELTIECNQQYRPGTFVIVWSRRSRRYTSKPFECVPSTENTNVHMRVWAMPENIEFTTTLYRGEKSLQFEEKEWICQIEDVGNVTTSRLSGPSVRRRVLATRQIDLSEFAANIPTQTSLKVVMRLASKKLVSASLLITLHSVIMREGEATDEDMISIASLMSLSRAGSFSVGGGLTIHDVGGGPFSPQTPRLSVTGGSVRCGAVNRLPPASATNFHADLTELTAKLQALERLPHEDVSNPVNDRPTKDTTDSDRENVHSGHTTFSSTGSFSGDVMSRSAFSSTSSLPNSTNRSIKQESQALATQSGQDLLVWCQQVTKDYPNVKITDLTSSFQSGLAFCAIINHFFPDQLDFSQLSANNPVENCRLAFSVAAKLGIPRVLDPGEVTSKSRALDLLSMMTYLHQLRTHCCGRAAESTDSNTLDSMLRLSNTGTDECNTKPLQESQSTEPSSVNHYSNHVTPNFSPAKATNSDVSTRDSKTRSSIDIGAFDSKLTTDDKSLAQKQNTSMRYEHMLAKARSMLQQTRLQQQGLAPFTEALPPLANARKSRPSSTSTFTGIPSSSSAAAAPANKTADEEQKIGDGPSYLSDPCSAFALRNRPVYQRSSTRRKKSHRTLMRFNSDGTICMSNGGGSVSHSPPNPAGSNSLHQSMDIHSPGSSTTKNPPITASVQSSPPDGMKVRRLRLSQLNLFASGRGTTAPVPICPAVDLPHSPKYGFSPSPVHKSKVIPNAHVIPASASSSPTTYRYALTDFQSPNRATQSSTTGTGCSNYISNEQAELEQAQRELDYEAAHLEQRLRLQMARGTGTAAEDELLKRWFVLVSRKSTLIRRGMQLSIMEKEDDLKKKTQMLQDELRKLLSVEDYMKTDSDRRREDLLLQDLVQLINERDDMIHELDLHEQALAEELTLEQNAVKAFTSGRERTDRCIIQ
ncbi:EH domain-binding protein 1 [Fasciola hepatica]|uniref:EH domain-binding protein 1 n=1 Tax=Fasciola hepatica TaxID=6192 RepID=A0A4E0REU8_FASHE|nr:EH domain-binding protein 1 [Fasciola hepatica]